MSSSLSAEECRSFLSQAHNLLDTREDDLLIAYSSLIEEAERLLDAESPSLLNECRSFISQAEEIVASTRLSAEECRTFLDRAERTVFEHWHGQIERLQVSDPRNHPDFQAINLLKIFGISRREAPHSRFLGWLLDPQGSHGLGTAFLESFLHTAQKVCGCDFESDLEDVQVELERSTDKGVPDITIIGSNFVCVVENKIRSAEGQDQTQRYANAGEEEVAQRGIPPAHLLLVFLSPTGRQPKDNRFHPLSYTPLLQVLQELLEQDVTTLVEIAIKQFVFNLRARVLHEYEQEAAIVRHLEGYEERGDTYLREYWREITKLARIFGGKHYG
jgi:hypothetical protein